MSQRVGTFVRVPPVGSICRLSLTFPDSQCTRVHRLVATWGESVLEPEAERAIYRSLVAMGLIAPGDTPPLLELTGGVSADIVRADLPRGPVCIKRSLPSLKVATVWQASPARVLAEQAWIALVGAYAPGRVPELLGSDPANFTFAMAYLDDAVHRNWKLMLRDGKVSNQTGAQIGSFLGNLHKRTENDPAVAAAFANDADFADLRLRPYLLAAAERHADVAPRLRQLAARTAATHEGLVHGDFSPKNILIGADGPVFLDAECAWYGDPAFDPAFCLNHLLLKGAWHPAFATRYLGCAEAFWTAYLAARELPDQAAFEARVATLLPGLMLARIDGQSPVEYLTDSHAREQVRGFAKRLLRAPPETVGAVCEAWQKELAA